MNRLKVVQIGDEELIFDDGSKLYSYHEQECGESHYLSFDDLELRDFEGLQFDLTNDNFFNRIPGYGIELIPINGCPVKIPGYGYQNGYYCDDIDLVVKIGKTGEIKSYDITECQDYTPYD